MAPRLESVNGARVVVRGRGGMVKETLPICWRPFVQPREWRFVEMRGRPMRVRVGRRTWEMYSWEGDIEVFVPPEIFRRIGLEASSGGESEEPDHRR